MEIVYITNHIGQTGVNQVIKDLVNVMSLHGHRCKVFYLKDAENTMDYSCPVSKLNRVEDLDGYDVIHTHGIWPELYLLKHYWHWWKNSEDKRTKLITTLHCYCFQDFLDLYGRLKGFLLGVLYLFTKISFDKVVCLSKDMMRYYQGYIPKRKLTYAYNTRIFGTPQTVLSNDEIEEIKRFKGDGTLIGMNCVLLYRKGIDVMLRALALLPAQYKFFIAGDGKERETFEEMAHALGVSERVHFAGMRKDAYRYLPFYDIYVLPSRSEGFPISLLEAAAYGCKVVASRLPAVEECFTEEDIAKFDMPNENALAEAILQADLNTEIGKNLRRTFEQKYSPEVFYKKYLDIYNL